MEKIGECENCEQWDYCHGGPMHKRLANGDMFNCLYKIYHKTKDYNAVLPEEVFSVTAGN